MQSVLCLSGYKKLIQLSVVIFCKHQKADG